MNTVIYIDENGVTEYTAREDLPTSINGASLLSMLLQQGPSRYLNHNVKMEIGSQPVQLNQNILLIPESIISVRINRDVQHSGNMFDVHIISDMCNIKQKITTNMDDTILDLTTKIAACLTAEPKNLLLYKRSGTGIERTFNNFETVAHANIQPADIITVTQFLDNWETVN